MILKEQVLAVIGRKNTYEEAGAYYEGTTPEVFATSHLRRAMRTSGYSANLNFCRPVVDSVQNRLEINTILGTSDAGTKIIGDTWEFNELALDANEIHRHALIYGDAFAMVWPDDEGNVEVAYHSPLNMALVYDPEHPLKKLYAVKVWEVAEGTRLNLYTAEAVYKYSTSTKTITEGTQWDLAETVENPFGEVPVFHFRTHRPYGRSEHRDAFDAQNYINKQFIQSMYVADYQGAPQRYALSKAGTSSEIADFNEGDTERENIAALQNGPGQLWYMNDVDKVGQFQPADPRVFWEPIKDTIRSMASITNTPLHYFEKTGNVPSGEALRVAEAPLMKKVNDRQAAFGQTWRELFKFVLKVSGLVEDVQVKWVQIESIDELELWDLAAKQRNVGVSLRQVLRERGYDEEVIEQIVAEAAEERAVGDVSGYERAANTNPDVRVQVQNDERSVDA